MTSNSDIVSNNVKLLSVIQESKEFLDAQNSRDLDIPQIRIILNKLLKQIKDEFNNYFIDNQSDLAEFTKITTSAVNSMKDVVHAIPKHEGLKHTYMEYYAFYLHAIRMLSRRSDMDHTLKRLSLANSLINILSGDLYVELDLDVSEIRDINDLNLFISWFNIQSSVVVILSNLIRNLSIIRIGDLIEWSNVAFMKLEKIEKRIKDLNYQKLYDIISKSNLSYFQTVYALNLFYSFKIDLALGLYQKLGENWPDKLDPGRILSDKSIAGLIELVDKSTASMQTNLQQIIELYERGVIDKNDNPHDNTMIKRWKSLIKDYQSFISRLQLFKKLDIPHGLSKPENIEEFDREELFDIIERFEYSLSRLEKSIDNREDILESLHSQKFVSLIKAYLAALTLLSIKDRSKTIYELKMENYKFIFMQKNIPLYPELFMYKTMSELFYDCYFGLGDNFSRFRNELYLVREFSKTDAPTFASTSILISILSHSINDMSMEEIEDILVAGLQALKQQKISHLVSEYDKYITILFDVFLGGEVEYNFPTRYRQINYLDHLSWMIPDFWHMIDVENAGNILYLPFNRKMDRIMK